MHFDLHHIAMFHSGGLHQKPQETVFFCYFHSETHATNPLLQ